MDVNMRRGLLRLWTVSSIIWVAAVGVFTYADIGKLPETPSSPLGFIPYLPMRCAGDLHGVAGSDYKREKDGLCWYAIDKFRALYPEYNDLDDETLMDKVYAKAGLPLKRSSPWALVPARLAIAAGVPLAVLALGWAVFWVISGFRRPPVQG